MRPDVLVGPSEWVVEQFGDKVAAEIWTRVPEALSTAIEREVTARPATAQAAAPTSPHRAALPSTDPPSGLATSGPESGCPGSSTAGLLSGCGEG